MLMFVNAGGGQSAHDSISTGEVLQRAHKWEQSRFMQIRVLLQFIEFRHRKKLPINPRGQKVLVTNPQVLNYVSGHESVGIR